MDNILKGEKCMNYSRQIKEIVNHFKNNEKKVEDFKLGVEFEHFVIDKDTMETISYYGENGIEETLKELEENGWKGSYEEDYILGLHKDVQNISIEPGGQLEFSMDPKANIEDIEKGYLGFLKEIITILEKKNQGLISVGYHPNKKINDIKLLPKKRYDHMFNYFKTKGSHAHNMMKGTAALQVSLDYKSEEDYIKKFRVANALSPVLYAICDNAFYFEGGKWDKHNLRTHIWNNCDNDRSGVVNGALDDGFSYEKYAEYILEIPPIFIMKGSDPISTGDKKIKDVFNPEDYTVEGLEYLLTMVFPDVRTKRFIEIRMMDSIPYPLSLGVVSLLKGIFYNEENLDKVYKYLENVNIDDIKESKLDIIENGLEGNLEDKTIIEIARYIIKLAKVGLPEQEIKYILPLERIINEGKNPYEITKEKSNLGKKEALQWCLLNNLIEVK